MTPAQIYDEARKLRDREIAEMCERLVAEHGAAEAMRRLRAWLAEGKAQR